MIEGWAIGLVANATIATAYLAVAALLGVNAIRTDQWRTNTLGLMTVFLYVTCGGGHAVYALQMTDVALGRATAAAGGAQVLYAGWHMWAWDLVTAGVGVWYWTMRKSFPDLVTGTAVFEDLRERQKRALALHDNVVQGLVRAKLSLDLGRAEEGQRAVDETLDASNRIVADLLPPQARSARGR